MPLSDDATDIRRRNDHPYFISVSLLAFRPISEKISVTTKISTVHRVHRGPVSKAATSTIAVWQDLRLLFEMAHKAAGVVNQMA